MKSIIVYTRELKAQNLYPKKIVSPPEPNKCCPGRMEVIGQPKVDEQGRRFSYKRCQRCGFALRHFLDPVGTTLPPPNADAKGRKALPVKDRAPLSLSPMVLPRRPPVATAQGTLGRTATAERAASVSTRPAEPSRTGAPERLAQTGRHPARRPPARARHAAASGSKGSARRRR